MDEYVVLSEADRLAQLVSNLLDLSRQEAGLLLLKRVPARIQNLVPKTIERLNHSGATISVELPNDLPLVNIDSGRIEVVLHNLVANALVYGVHGDRAIHFKEGDTCRIPDGRPQGPTPRILSPLAPTIRRTGPHSPCISECKPADKGKYLYTVYSEVGHVYASFISLRLHFHYSHTAQFILSGEFGWKGKYIVVPSSEKVRKKP